jgi:hypothetical protein
VTKTPEPSDEVAKPTRFDGPNDQESVIAQGTAEGLSEERLRACLATLKPIFDGLSFGEQPPYRSLDTAALARLEPETGFVVRSMARSRAADLKIAGYHVMGVLDSSSFIPDLEAGIESEQEWERVEAVRALGRMDHPDVRAILLTTSEHADPQTRRAAIEALSRS